MSSKEIRREREREREREKRKQEHFWYSRITLLELWEGFVGDLLKFEIIIIIEFSAYSQTIRLLLSPADS